MLKVTGWFLRGINFDAAPSSMDELRASSKKVILSKDELLRSTKWEPLFQGKQHDATPGFISLGEMASFRRGIATGANDFFSLSKSRFVSLGISVNRCLPRVGRATDVRGLIYWQSDFRAAAESGGKLFLLNLTDPLTAPEKLYVQQGVDLSLPSRFLLANRRPWYSMEQRPVAPIWAAVFGRGDLKFVFNEAGVRSLTNFHCIYPHRADETFCKALTLCLNASSVREASKMHGRVYGGGLNKFEPNDLKTIEVPDLRAAPARLLAEMADLLDDLNKFPEDSALKQRAEDFCAQAALAATRG